MSVFLKMAFPMLCVAMTMFYLAHKKQGKNYVLPGFILLATAFVNVVIGVITG